MKRKFHFERNNKKLREKVAIFIFLFVLFLLRGNAEHLGELVSEKNKNSYILEEKYKVPYFFNKQISWEKIISLSYPYGNVYFNSPPLSRDTMKIKILGFSENCTGYCIEIKKRILSGYSFNVYTYRDINFKIPNLKKGNFSKYKIRKLSDARLSVYSSSLSLSNLESIRVGLKLRSKGCSLYLDDKAVLAFPFDMGFTPESIYIESTEKKSYSPKFEKAGDFKFHDDFMVPKEERDTQLAAWDKISGNWYIHSVLDAATAEETSKRLKQRPLEAERSPNFYNLKGIGKNALIATGYNSASDYFIQAAINISEGTGGIAFYITEKEFYSFLLFRENKYSDKVFTILAKHLKKEKKVEILNVKRMSLLQDNWYLLKVIALGNTVRCFVDNTKIIEENLILPISGRFGLFVNSQSPVLFDDINAGSIHGFKTENPLEAIKLASFLSDGVYSIPGFFSHLFLKSKTSDSLFSTLSHTDRCILFGTKNDKKQIFSVGFSPQINTSREYSVGLIFAYHDSTKPYFLLAFEKKPLGSKLTLHKVIPYKSMLPIGECKTDHLSPYIGHKSFNLKINISNPNIVKCYLNSKLVGIFSHNEYSFTGAVGIWEAGNSSVPVKNISLRFPEEIPEENLFTDKKEKNTIFAKDPYMRHWASPEGQWLQNPKRETCFRFKGDILGDFWLSLPFIKNSAINLFVPDNKTEGSIKILFHEKNGEFILARNGTKELKQKTKVLFKLPKDISSKKNRALYTLHYEYPYIWFTYHKKIFSKFFIKSDRPLYTHITVDGFSVNDLSKSRLTRQNVKDIMFTTAPYQWIKNGGKWEIINRFMCDPRWSHMNGESKDNLADIWSKYKISGNFCIEMYVGIRHGEWYKRVGDMNLTVYNNILSPSNGYTFICTGWDPNHSQLFSRLFDNGKIIKVSKKYLAPRYREGNYRKYHNPLIGSGRSVHGAWYYIKVRKIRNRIMYYFDNEKIFDFKDSHHQHKGGLGIWTFMNSIVIARVKIAADEISHKTIKFSEPNTDDNIFIKTVFKKTYKRSKNKNSKKEYTDSKLTEITLFSPSDKNNNKDFSSPTYWFVKPKKTGRPSLNFRKLCSNDTEAFIRARGIDTTLKGAVFPRYSMKFKNKMCGGKLFLRAKLPLFPADRVAGWKFFVKNISNAKFNFHYQLGYLDKKKKYHLFQRYFYRISGSDFSQDIYLLSGDLRMLYPDTNKLAKIWLPITVIAPKEKIENCAKHGTPVWKVIGFGNLQPSDIIQGLTCNPPGTWYSVAAFAPILIKKEINNINPSDCYLISDNKYKRINCFDKTQKELNDMSSGTPTLIKIKGLTPFFLNWEAEEGGAEIYQPSWNKPAVKVAMEYRRDPTARNHFLKIKNYKYGERLYCCCKRKNKISAVNYPLLQFRYSADWMTNITLLMPNFLHIYLSENNYKKAVKIPSCTRFIKNSIPDYGEHFVLPPYITKNFSEDNSVYFSDILSCIEPFVIFSPLYHPQSPKYVWTGKITDGYKNFIFPYAFPFNIPWICFSSFSTYDQTGKLSEFDIDDIILGPAVSTDKQLAFIPVYTPETPSVDVYMAVSKDKRPYDSLSEKEKKAVKWLKFKNKSEIIPDINDLKDGIYQIFIKGVNQNGCSKVTSFPFMLDRQPMNVSWKFVKTDKPLFDGSSLRMKFITNGYALPDFNKFKIMFKGKTTSKNLSIQHIILRNTPTVTTIDIPWIYKLHQHLQLLKNRETAMLYVSNLVDGAGNRSENIKIPIVINFSKDKTPPDFLPVRYVMKKKEKNYQIKTNAKNGEKIKDDVFQNIHRVEVIDDSSYHIYSLKLLGNQEPQKLIPSLRNCKISIINNFNHYPHICLTTRKNTNLASVTIGKYKLRKNGEQCSLADYPFFAIRYKIIKTNSKPSLNIINPNIKITFYLTNSLSFSVPLNAKRIKGIESMSGKEIKKYLWKLIKKNKKKKIDIKPLRRLKHFINLRKRGILTFSGRSAPYDNSKWEEIIINAQKLAKDKFKHKYKKPASHKDIKVKKIVIMLNNYNRQEIKINIGVLRLFKPLTKNHGFQLLAYDASGVAEVTTRFFPVGRLKTDKEKNLIFHKLETSRQKVISYSADYKLWHTYWFGEEVLKMTDNYSGWLSVKFTDRAGNRTKFAYVLPLAIKQIE